MSQNPVILTISRHSNQFLFDLSEINTLIQKNQVRCDNALISDILAGLKTIFHEANSQTFISQSNLLLLKKLGQCIYQHFLSSEIRKALLSQDCAELFLRLDDQLCVGRQIITSHSFNSPPLSSIQKNTSVRILIICNPTGDLPATQQEAEHLVDLFDENPGFEVEILGGEKTRKVDVISALSDCDIIHFAGHSVYVPQNSEQSGWLLHDGILPPTFLQNISHPPYLFFSNSCVSAHIENREASTLFSEGGEFGLGGRVLLSGTRHYVGSLCPLMDAYSSDFAQEFYKGILAGQSLGRALYLARKKLRADSVQKGMHALGYIHYGRPDESIPVPESPSKIAPACKQRDIHQVFDTPATENQESNKHSMRGKGVLLSSAGIILLVTITFLSQMMTKPIDIPADYKQAVDKYSAGHIPQAIALFQKLTQLPQEQNEASYGFGDLAQIYLEAGLTDKAKEILKKASSREAVNTMSYIMKGDILFSQNEYAKATENYDLAIKVNNGLSSQLARAANALGVVQWINGQTDKSRSIFPQALQEDADYVDAWANLQFVASAQKNGPLQYNPEAGRFPDDEAIAFAGKLQSGEKKTKTQEGIDENILAIGPFFLSGGTKKRLDYNWVLTRMIKKSIETDKFFRQMLCKPMAHKHLPNSLKRNGLESEDQEKIINFFRETYQADIAVFGQISPFEHVVFGRVVIAQISSGKILLDRSIKADKPHYINKVSKNIVTSLEILK
jgi:tetratricopeptide (TPR) repeat protein